MVLHQPYRVYHSQLVAAVGSPTDYSAPWRTLAQDIKMLVTAQGFDPKALATPDAVRARLGKPASEAAVLRAAARAPASDTGDTAVAGARRALALKTLRHLYMHRSVGKQQVWILSLPSSLRAYPVEYAKSSAATVDAVLDSGGERFKPEQRETMGNACQLALAWVGRAMVVVGDPARAEHRKIFRRWFIPADTKDELGEIARWAKQLMPYLLKISAGLKTGQVILTDSPHLRGSTHVATQWDAFVWIGDLIAIHFEPGAFNHSDMLTGAAFCGRLIVHELSHLYAETRDHAYSWQGLLPRNTDVFKAVNDAYVKSWGFRAVRTLSLSQCKENADTWALFVADCAGAVSESARLQALGGQLYGIGGRTMDAATEAMLKNRAA